MPFRFRIWDQAHDDMTMGIRVDNLDEIRRLAVHIEGEDAAGNWDSLAEYLDFAETAQVPPVPFVRNIDIVWLNENYPTPTAYCQDRRLRVTYSGRVRADGGFASQAYCIVDPAWWEPLREFHQAEILVDYYSGHGRDLVLILP